MKRLLRCLLPALLLASPLAAVAADGYLIADTQMFAGPDPQYPLIDQLPPNTWVSVQGCTAGWAWCDVIAGPERGWVPGSFIGYPYGGQPVYVSEYGPRLGIPIIGFAIAAYWGRYYVNRPFYGERARWYGRPAFPMRPPPMGRPPMRPPPPGRPGFGPGPHPGPGPGGRPGPDHGRPMPARPAPRPQPPHREPARPAPPHMAPRPPQHGAPARPSGPPHGAPARPAPHGEQHGGGGHPPPKHDDHH